MKIKKINKIENNSKLYDLQTKNHNFFANGILVHNSITKLWWSDRFAKWIVSTNGTIYAQNADLMFPKNGINNFREMFMEAYNKTELVGSPSKDATHVFELVGPQNRVVIPYEEIELFYLTSVNNETLKEYEDEAFKKFPVPLSYYFKSLEETIEFTKSEGFNTFRNEGFVVKDGNFNRIKIKTEDYLRIHRMRGETNPTPLRFLELMRTNEQEEFLSYFPEYRSEYDSFKEKYINYRHKLDELTDYFCSIKDLDRKEFAMKAKKTFCPSYLFGLLDGKYSVASEYMQQMRDKNLIEAVIKESK
jgi:hypothetical protein